MLQNTVKLANSMYSKKNIIPFLFSIFMCVFINLWFLQYFYYFADNLNIIMSVSRVKNLVEQYPRDSKFILVWNKYNNILKRFGIKNGLLNCSTNCVVTEDMSLLYDYNWYDGIIFNEFTLNSIDRPTRRSKFQFYVFSSQTSSNDAPACELYNDNFFNLTFTYKLDSDLLWSYIAVRNLSGTIVAPNTFVNWKKASHPVNSDIKTFVNQKRKAAVWIVSSEERDESNVEYITRLQEHLFHYSLKIDLFGAPPLLNCPDNDCEKAIRDEYYFYIAFENSISADYVVLMGYNNYAVPIVYGGADYGRFLPPGSYINARNIHPYNLAHLMHKAIKDPTLYEGYFRWRTLYSIQDNSKSLAPLCEICEIIHRSQGNATAKLASKRFRRWWNGLDGMKMCLSDAYWNERSNLNVNRIYHLK